MKKEEYIRKYGPVAWEARLSKTRRTRIRNKVDKSLKAIKEVKKENYVEQEELLRDQWKEDNGAKLRSRLSECVIRDRNKIRQKHNVKWGRTGLDIHHSWKGQTAEYAGVALVERAAHRKGIINIIILLEGVVE